jgi:hypothetical protein
LTDHEGKWTAYQYATAATTLLKSEGRRAVGQEEMEEKLGGEVQGAADAQAAGGCVRG